MYERKQERNPRPIIIYSHIMAAVKASTCINVFMRRRTSTHTHTHAHSISASVKAFCMSAQQKENAQKGTKGMRGGGVGNARKTITIHNSVGCRSASGTRLASDVRSAALRCAVLLLMSLPHSCCRCIASMPQRGIFHIGMCTMEITMHSQSQSQRTNNHPANLVEARNIQPGAFPNTNPKCRRASHEPRA